MKMAWIIFRAVISLALFVTAAILAWRGQYPQATYDLVMAIFLSDK